MERQLRLYKQFKIWVPALVLSMVVTVVGFAQSHDAMKAFRPKVQMPKSADTPIPVNKEPKGKIAFVMQDNARIDSVMDTLHVYNRHIKSVMGYRLQVYSGVDRATALKTKEQLYKLFPDLELYLQFVQPIFKLKAGDFLTRYDALRAANKVKTQFPNAVIVQDEVKARP